jgi:cytochrome b involved in lipid metabolism
MTETQRDPRGGIRIHISMGKTTLAKFSEEEVAKHNTPESCWIVINGKVLDVTKWLANHPGGKSVLLSVGGKDATFDFSTIGHSAGAWTASEKYVIGEIGPPGA